MTHLLVAAALAALALWAWLPDRGCRCDAQAYTCARAGRAGLCDTCRDGCDAALVTTVWLRHGTRGHEPVHVRTDRPDGW